MTCKWFFLPEKFGMSVGLRMDVFWTNLYFCLLLSLSYLLVATCIYICSNVCIFMYDFVIFALCLIYCCLYIYYNCMYMQSCPGSG